MAHFNTSMDKQLHYDKYWDEITYPYPNFKGATNKIWEWISNFSPHFIVYAII